VTLPNSTYARLLALRTGLRHFERWSAKQARAAGLTPAQHQLLLAIRGHQGEERPTIGEVADYLFLRHHSTVELVDRAEAAGLVERQRSLTDHRVVRLSLTAEGEARLEALSALHLEELERLELDLPRAWDGLAPTQRHHGFPGEPVGAGGRRGIAVARVYDKDRPEGTGVLVDRLWPRGLSKAEAPFELWVKELAPSAGLRKWYGHRPERFEEFSRRYRDELDSEASSGALERLDDARRSSPLVLMTATGDLEHSGALVLKKVLEAR
jgi:uncharacterized protein YeaO (DUF488 family)/DNA-binding MarR family transcriptional regulator